MAYGEKGVRGQREWAQGLFQYDLVDQGSDIHQNMAGYCHVGLTIREDGLSL